MREIITFTGGKRPQEQAEAMANDIKAAVYAYSDKVPLALAIGVLDIVKKEIMDAT